MKSFKVLLGLLLAALVAGGIAGAEHKETQSLSKKVGVQSKIQVNTLFNIGISGAACYFENLDKPGPYIFISSWEDQDAEAWIDISGEPQNLRLDPKDKRALTAESRSIRVFKTEGLTVVLDTKIISGVDESSFMQGVLKIEKGSSSKEIKVKGVCSA